MVGSNGIIAILIGLLATGGADDSCPVHRGSAEGDSVLTADKAAAIGDRLLRMRFLLWLVAAVALGQPYDVLIKNGRVADGTGNPTFLADVAISGGKIAAIGKLTGPAKTTIDAKGMIVAPGFIDIHNHSDTSLLADGNAQSFLRQGVTTMIFGEGPSAAPSRDFPRFTNYWERLLKTGISPNVGSYVG